MERSSFDIIAELVARDIDKTLLRRAMAKTPTERVAWLEQMQDLAKTVGGGRADAADRTSKAPR